MAEGYYLLIDGWKLKNGFDQIFVIGEPIISGIKKGESKMLKVEVKPGAFDAHFMNTYYKQTPILKIRLMKGMFLHEGQFADPDAYQEVVENSHKTGQLLFSFLDCKLIYYREPPSSGDIGYIENVVDFSYTTIVRNIPDIPKPTLPNQKTSKAKTVRKK